MVPLPVRGFIAALLLLAGKAFAVDVVAWEPDSACVYYPVTMTLDSSGDRGGIEFTIRFDATKLAVNSVSTTGDAINLRGSAFHVVEPGVLAGVLFDDVGSGVIQSGVGPVVTVHFRPLVFPGNHEFAAVTFDEIVVADAAIQPIEASALPLYVTVAMPPICETVEVAISDLLAEQQQEGAVRISWRVAANEAGSFDVLRASGASEQYTKVNDERIYGAEVVTFLDLSDEVKRGGTFSYKLVATEPNGDQTFFGPVRVTTTDRTLPVRFALYQNAPNPVVGNTLIRYDVPQAQHVEIRLYNVAGRLVRTLVDGRQQPGRLQVLWDRTDRNGTRVASGIYFAKMKTQEFVGSHKIVVR